MRTPRFPLPTLLLLPLALPRPLPAAEVADCMDQGSIIAFDDSLTAGFSAEQFFGTGTGGPLATTVEWDDGTLADATLRLDFDPNQQVVFSDACGGGQIFVELAFELVTEDSALDERFPAILAIQSPQLATLNETRAFLRGTHGQDQGSSTRWIFNTRWNEGAIDGSLTRDDTETEQVPGSGCRDQATSRQIGTQVDVAFWIAQTP